jgi:restriction endonuclease
VTTLDFNKLSGTPKGEAFEALIRLLGERFGMVVQWSGRGADGGRDLIFIETQSGPISTRLTRWLVSCKDNSESNRAVTEKDVGSVLDKMNQHKCAGFLLATTTTASTGLKEMLDRFDGSRSGRIQTKVWDRFEITRMLLSANCADLLLQFFPDHIRKEAVATLDAARKVVEASLPRFVAGQVRARLVAFDERLELLSGKNIWPHDSDQQALIDEIRMDAVSMYRMKRAVERSQHFHFDAFMSFADALIRNFPLQATVFLKQVARSSNDGGVIYNAIELLRENGEFSLGEELEITRRCDSDTLFELYNDMVHDVFFDTGTWDHHLPREANRLADEIEIIKIRVDELDISGGDSVCVSARISMDIKGHSSEPNEPSVDHCLSYAVDAHFEHDGLEIDSIA